MALPGPFSTWSLCQHSGGDRCPLRSKECSRDEVCRAEVGGAAGPGIVMLVRRRVRGSRWADDDRRLGGRQKQAWAPTGRGRDSTAGLFDAMRDARGVCDRLNAQYRDCDGCAVVDDRRQCRVSNRLQNEQRSGQRVPLC